MPSTARPSARISFSSAGSSSSTTMQTVDRRGEGANGRLRQRIGGAELEDRDVGRDLLDVEIGGRAGDDADARVALLPAGQRRGLEIAGERRLARRELRVQPARVGGNGHRLRRLVDEALGGGSSRGPTRTALRVCDSRVVERTITGVSNVSEISKASLTKSCASCASLGSSDRHAGEAREQAGVLLVLRGMEARIVADHDHQAGVRADVGLRHQRVGGDVEADVLHRRERANAGQRGADRHVERDLLVGRPFGVEVGGGIARRGSRGSRSTACRDRRRRPARPPPRRRARSPRCPSAARSRPPPGSSLRSPVGSSPARPSPARNGLCAAPPLSRKKLRRGGRNSGGEPVRPRASRSRLRNSPQRRIDLHQKWRAATRQRGRLAVARVDGGVARRRSARAKSRRGSDDRPKSRKPSLPEPIETASRDELAALQIERLKWTLRRVYDRVPHYRAKFDAAGVHPDDLEDPRRPRQVPLHHQEGPARQLSLRPVRRAEGRDRAASTPPRAPPGVRRWSAIRGATSTCGRGSWRDRCARPAAGRA